MANHGVSHSQIDKQGGVCLQKNLLNIIGKIVGASIDANRNTHTINATGFLVVIVQDAGIIQFLELIVLSPCSVFAVSDISQIRQIERQGITLRINEFLGKCRIGAFGFTNTRIHHIAELLKSSTVDAVTLTDIFKIPTRELGQFVNNGANNLDTGSTLACLSIFLSGLRYC